MTRITKTATKHGIDCIKVNGRDVFGLTRIDTIEQCRCRRGCYEWTGTTTSGWDFTIWGGKKSGGAANEWYADFLEMSIPVKSAVEALRTINNA